MLPTPSAQEMRKVFFRPRRSAQTPVGTSQRITVAE